MSATLFDVRTATNLSSYEKTLIASFEEWQSPDYDNMDMDEILGEDSQPMFQTADWDSVRAERDMERRVDVLCDLVERMQKGMKLIQETTAQRDSLRTEYHAARDEFTALMNKLNEQEERFKQLLPEAAKRAQPRFSNWKAALWIKAKPLNETRKIKGAQLGELNQKLSKYWELWFQIQKSAHELKAWGGYYSLLNEELNRWCTRTQDAVDQDVLDRVTAPTDEARNHWRLERLECERDMHVYQMLEYDREVHINWQPTAAEAEVILASDPF